MTKEKFCAPPCCGPAYSRANPEGSLGQIHIVATFQGYARYPRLDIYIPQYIFINIKQIKQLDKVISFGKGFELLKQGRGGQNLDTINDQLYYKLQLENYL